MVEHAVETGSLSGIFGEREGLRAIDEGIRVRDDLPRGGDAFVDVPAAHFFEVGGHGLGHGLAQGLIDLVIVVAGR